uniref:Uncharacterized protein n=1 Tax=Pyxicephalus adspersus TaxID=30357 RepID=A0AAV3ANJ3_PYXAD|nr:TPA: hypothetical protein GDO54_000752 [Pyxicephalus adspersus]
MNSDRYHNQAEKLEEKKRMDDIRRKERWAENMQKKNSEFLDQLSLTTNSSSSDISNGIIHNEWELDEERMLQLVLEESMKTKSEEDERRQKLEKNQPWKERRSDDEALDWAPHNPEWKEYTEYIASQQSYRKQLMEEERRLQNLKGENCRKKLEEEEKRQEMEKTE